MYHEISLLLAGMGVLRLGLAIFLGILNVGLGGYLLFKKEWVGGLPLERKFEWNGKWFWIWIVGILGVGMYLRWVGLDRLTWFGDEFRHVLTAMGWNETGRMQYPPSLVGEDLVIPYPRAGAFSWQVAQVIEWFGVTVFTSRLVSVVWGSVLLGVAVYLAYQVWGKSLSVLLFLSQLVWDPTLVWQSRLVRMYSVYYVSVLVAWLLVWRMINDKSQRTWVHISLLLGILIWGFHIHRLMTLVIVGLVLGFAHWVIHCEKVRTPKIFLGIGMAGLVVGGIIIYGRFIDWRSFRFEYALLLWKYFSIPPIAMGLASLGMYVGLRQKANQAVLFNKFLLLVGWIYISILMWLLGRFYDLRYIGPVLLIVYWFWAIGTEYALLWLSSRCKKVPVYLLLIPGLLLGTKLAIPGMTDDGWFTRDAVADSYPAEGLGYSERYKSAYDYLRSEEATEGILGWHSVHQMVFTGDLQVRPLARVMAEEGFGIPGYLIDENLPMREAVATIEENVKVETFTTWIQAYDILVVEIGLLPNNWRSLLEGAYSLQFENESVTVWRKYTDG